MQKHNVHNHSYVQLLLGKLEYAAEVFLLGQFHIKGETTLFYILSTMYRCNISLSEA